MVALINPNVIFFSQITGRIIVEAYFSQPLFVQKIPRAEIKAALF